MASTQVLCLDGSVFVITSDTLQPSQTVCNSLDVTIDGELQQFASSRGPDARNYGRRASELAADITLTQQYGFADGTLYVGVARGGDSPHTCVAVWESPLTSIYTVSAGIPETELVRRFEMLQPRQLEGAGVISEALPHARFEKAPEALVQLGGLGLLIASPIGSELADLIPDWIGTQVAGGELFIETSVDTPYYLVANDSAVAAVLPLVSVDDPKLLEELEMLRIEYCQDAL